MNAFTGETMIRKALWLIVAIGAIGTVVFGAYAWREWGALQEAYRQFENVAAASLDMATLYVAETKQNIHRLNLFAEGVWCLLAAILAAVGLHGLYTGGPGGRATETHPTKE